MRYRRRRIATLVAASLWLPGPAAAQQAPDPTRPGVDALIQIAESVCADSPAAAPSEDCRIAQRELAAGVTSALLKLGDSGERDAGVGVVREFAAWPFADVRYAVATALGGLFPQAEDTPILARLLNDPVPAVRGAALAALRQSSDPAARLLVGRAADPQGDGMRPDGPLVDPDALPVPLPDGAEPVRFTDDSEEGVAAFVTGRAPEDVLAGFAEAAGGPAITLDTLAGLFGVEAAPPVDMSDPIAMMRFMQELHQRIDELPEDQQQQAYMQAMQELAAAANPEEAGDPVARWRDADLYGGPMAVVLPDDPAAPAATPTRFAVVYRDLTLGRTGFALQWVEPAAMPPPPEPPSTIETAAQTEPATGSLFGQPAPAERDHLSGEEVEALLWEAVQASGDPAAAEAFADAFADGAHADEAEALAAALPPAPPDPEEAEQTQSSLFGSAVEPVEATPTITTERATFASNEPIVVRYRGLPANASRRQWIAVAPAGSPDTTWGDWAYADAGATGELTLPHQRPGDYELRAYLEAPRAVIARLPVTVAPADVATEPTLEADKDQFAVGETIGIRWSGMPGDRGDWITVVPAGTPDATWGDWAYTDRNPTGRLTLRGQAEPGDYEIRAYLEGPREVVARSPITIVAE